MMIRPNIKPAEPAGGHGYPRHVAIIMDGNGRWAQARGLPRYEGHRRGMEALRRIVRHAGDRRIEFLSLFSFSSENWSRPSDEIRDLMNLLRHFIRHDLAELRDNNVRVRVIGARTGLPPDILGLLQEAERQTADNDGMKLVVAFNYGGRDEIVRAARGLAEAVAAGDLTPDEITPAVLEAALDTAGIPDPDVMIRTSGELRISNFLLWQLAYTEFVFVPTHWPDFEPAEFDKALEEFSCRERRYGAVGSAG